MEDVRRVYCLVLGLRVLLFEVELDIFPSCRAVLLVVTSLVLLAGDLRLVPDERVETLRPFLDEDVLLEVTELFPEPEVSFEVILSLFVFALREIPAALLPA